jgi:hypothetical protein
MFRVLLHLGGNLPNADTETLCFQRGQGLVLFRYVPDGSEVMARRLKL